MVITLDARQKAQNIDNFGASGCWYAEGIGKHWPQEKKERIAQLLFSREMDKQGSPKGIGLSTWRFNIGGGTTEQGDSSGIKDEHRRVESFLRPDGTYDWSKQAGYVWFMRKAKQYGVEKLIAFSNTPPVQFTQNKLGFKTEKDFSSNLKANQYGAFADFLTEVTRHFAQEGLPFDYLSPVNEPQWDWAGKMGEAKQEGSPWRNDEIYKLVQSLNASLEQKQLATKILLPEAAMLTYLYGGSGNSAHQVPQFFDSKSPYYMGKFSHVPKLAAGHSYFTDAGDSAILAVRNRVAETARKHGVDFWQTEYSMLGDGFKEGAAGRRSAMDCGLFLAKLIHLDLTVANATAWQYWNAFEPGNADFNTRYYLISLQPNATHTDGTFQDTKNLWALGHYSRFIRPGMHRLQVGRSDKHTSLEEAQKLMVSAYADEKGQTVLVAINYTNEEQNLKLDVKSITKARSYRSYLTTAEKDHNMKALPARKVIEGVHLPARSITTVVFEKRSKF
ncbi:glycoside hydrolase [Rufibacter soli]